MRNMSLSFLMMVLIVLTGSLSNQWSISTSSNIFKSLVFENTNSTNWRIQDIEYDANTGDFFYTSYIYQSDLHFVSRTDYIGNLVWYKAYSTDVSMFSNHHTLQYSATNQTLYYTLNSIPMALIKVNSSNGDVLNSYQVPGTPQTSGWSNRCRLSKDEVVIFWFLIKSTNEYFEVMISMNQKILYFQEYSLVPCILRR